MAQSDETVELRNALLNIRTVCEGWSLDNKAKVEGVYRVACQTLANTSRTTTPVDAETSQSVTDWVAEAFGATDNEFRRVARGNEEMAELITKVASNASTDEIAEEAADVGILLHLICGRRGRDLNAEIDRKMGINRSRKWAVDETGCGYHIKEAAE